MTTGGEMHAWCPQCGTGVDVYSIPPLAAEAAGTFTADHAGCAGVEVYYGPPPDSDD